MQAATSENLFGVQTHYGTHPRQPHPRRTRAVIAAGALAATAMAAAVAAWAGLR